MNNKELEIFKYKLQIMPKRHPFENAKICTLYSYSNTPIYVTNPAYDAFTYPTYDKKSKTFNYQHYDMEAETTDDIIIDLIELFNADYKNNFRHAIKICNMFNIPKKDIETYQKEVKKLYMEE